MPFMHASTSPSKSGRSVKARSTAKGRAKAQDAIKLLNKRRAEIDNRTISASDVTIGNLLDLYLADKRNTKGYGDAETYVRLHLRPAFGKV